jgi:hypothetical protein
MNILFVSVLFCLDILEWLLLISLFFSTAIFLFCIAAWWLAWFLSWLLHSELASLGFVSDLVCLAMKHMHTDFVSNMTAVTLPSS